MSFSPIEELVAAIGRGEIVVITDDENRENEGDLIAAAALTTPQTVNFMLTHGRGLFCVPLDSGIAARLSLAQPHGKHDPRCTCFTQSVDAITGTTTGVSAFDRAKTVQERLDAYLKKSFLFFKEKNVVFCLFCCILFHSILLFLAIT